jgi:mannose-6-phosphate isomerase-like protein (cupin superfamily)
MKLLEAWLIKHNFLLPSNGYRRPLNFIKGKYEPKIAYSQEHVDRNGNRITSWIFPKEGYVIEPHTHKFRHDSIIEWGSVVVTGDAEGRNGIVLTAPDIVFFEAGVEHSVRSLGFAVMTHTYPKDLKVEELGN